MRRHRHDSVGRQLFGCALGRCGEFSFGAHGGRSLEQGSRRYCPTAQFDCVLAGRNAELAAILPTKLGWAVIANVIANGGHIAVLGGQHQPGFLQPDLLLKLDRADRGSRLKVSIEG